MNDAKKMRAAGNGDFVWHRNAWVKRSDSLPTEATALPENETAPAFEPKTQMPQDGWPLREAFRHLFDETHEQICAAALFAAEISGDEENFRHYLDIVWKMMAKRIEDREVIATGFGPGASTRGDIDPSLVSFLAPDLPKSCLCSDDLVFRAVRLIPAVTVEAAPDGSGATAEPAAPKSPRPPGRPTSMDIIEAEMRRRASIGEMLPSLASEARALAAWKLRAHPDAPSAVSESIENKLREVYSELKTHPHKITP